MHEPISGRDARLAVTWLTSSRTEKQLPNNAILISWNVANGSKTVTEPHAAISIFNFHYASPPKTVSLNYGLNKVIGLNETGFRGTNNTPYREEGVGVSC